MNADKGLLGYRSSPRTVMKNRFALDVGVTLLDGPARRGYGGSIMKSLEAKLLQIGNARGIRLPAAMIRKHQLDAGVVLEERDGEIVLRSKQVTKKLSWEETAQQMAAASEDWSDWEAVADGWNGE